MVPIPLVSAGYEGRSQNFDASRLINWYAEMEPDGKSVATLLPTPGKKLDTTLGSGPIRGMESFGGKRIVVSGDTVYEGSTSIGTLSSSSGPVKFAQNTTDLVIVDGVAAKSWDGTTFTNQPDIGAATHAAFIDQYIVFNVPGTGQFKHTNLSSLTVDGTDVATAESAPDDLVALIADHRQLWLFGTNSIEVFHNFGDVDQVFQRVEGSYIEHGCAAKYSVAKADNAVIWLNSNERGDSQLMMARGYQPLVVSTRPIEYQWSQYSVISDAVAWTEQHSGHIFYVINFPTADATWCFDMSTGLWHERSSYLIGRDRANAHVFHGGKHYVGDYVDGRVYEVLLTSYDDAGDAVIRERYFKYIHNNRERFFVDKFEIEFETGEAAVTESEPQVMLRWSDDNGRTWSNEYWRGLGLTGNYDKRATWHRCGYSRARIFHIAISDTVQHSLVGAYADIEAGDG